MRSSLAATEVRVSCWPWPRWKTASASATSIWAWPASRMQGGVADVTGTGDLTVGFRRALTAQGGDGAQVSIQGYVTAPTATHGLGAGGWAGGARLPAAVPLAMNLSLGLAPEVDVVRNAAGGGTHLALSLPVGVSRTFGKTTLGVEAWASVDDDPQARTYQASADFPVAQLLGDNAQLDAGVYLGLNRNTPDVEAYVGISHRF